MCRRYAVSRMRRIRWNPVVKIHHLDDLEEDRHSPWIAAAVDRARFRQRIETIGNLLQPILTRHYERYLDSECEVLDRMLKGCTIEQLNVR
jgi:hypothetical protein